MSSLVLTQQITITGIAELMKMEREFVAFFPLIEDLRGILKDYYCYGRTRRSTIEALKLLIMEVRKDESMKLYEEGIMHIIDKFEVS